MHAKWKTIKIEEKNETFTRFDTLQAYVLTHLTLNYTQTVTNLLAHLRISASTWLDFKTHRQKLNTSDIFLTRTRNFPIFIFFSERRPCCDSILNRTHADKMPSAIGDERSTDKMGFGRWLKFQIVIYIKVLLYRSIAGLSRSGVGRHETPCWNYWWSRELLNGQFIVPSDMNRDVPACLNKYLNSTINC